MRTSVLFFSLFAVFNLYPQFFDSFTDGDFTANPAWTGTVQNFRVNELFQLQSRAPQSSTSWLFTESEAIENAFWECHFIIDFTTSASNFACMYIISDVASLAGGIKGYYVMVGGTGDEVSLFYEHGSSRTKIIDGTDKRTDGRPVNIKVRVTRDSIGVFNLYSKLSSETDFYLEGSVQHTLVTKSTYFGLSFNNTSTTGNSYRFDDVAVSGRPVTIVLPPDFENFEIQNADSGDLVFNEVMFHNPDESSEYLEIYNRSSKLIDLSGIIFTTRRQDGTLNAGHIIPGQTLLQPGGYLCLTANPEMVVAYHRVPVESRIIKSGWSALNNTSATLVLLSANREIVIDEFTYHSNMHHVLIKDTKGVALERIMIQKDTRDASNWHSASSSSGFGTPGQRNSQYRSVIQPIQTEKSFWLDKSFFSPDNHGDNDICIVHYRLNVAGFVAAFQVLNSNGIVVYNNPEKLILSAEGQIVWNGITQSGKYAQQGIYVILIHSYHPLIGERRVYELPIVVSSQ